MNSRFARHVKLLVDCGATIATEALPLPENFQMHQANDDRSLLPGTIMVGRAETSAGIQAWTTVCDEKICAWAAELVRPMGLARLFVTRELAPGMVKLVMGEAGAVLLTIKPGPYA